MNLSDKKPHKYIKESSTTGEAKMVALLGQQKYLPKTIYIRVGRECIDTVIHPFQTNL